MCARCVLAEAEDFDTVGAGGAHVDIDRAPGLTSRLLVEALEVAGELATGDLRRRPPQRAAGPSVSSASWRRKRAERSVSSTPRRIVVNGSGSTGAPARAAMSRRGGVGLLAGDPALLDREGGDVAGGVDVRHAVHACVVVDDEEALGVPGAREGRAPRGEGA